MGKSKTVGNKKFIINIQPKSKTEEEKRQEREKLFEDIDNVLIPKMLEKSKVTYTLDEKKRECYKELIETLYYSKALNITNLKAMMEGK